MNRRYDLIGLSISGVAILLALMQWAASAGGNTLPSAVEFVQSVVLIPLAVVYVIFLTVRASSGFADGVGTFFTSRFNLPVPTTILAYLSTTWFSGFQEKYDVTAWHNGLALKGFWLGSIAQSHPSATNPFPNVHYGFWVNLLQAMVDHSVYSWFGYVVIVGELLVAVTFITTVLATIYRPALAIAGIGTLVALLFHSWFLMSGSAGVNALMPYLTGIAAVCLIGSWVRAYSPVPEVKPTIVLEPVAVPANKVSANGKTREPVKLS